MKKNLPLLLLLCFSLSSLWAQEVPEKQQALISKVSASWCINCGTWGWNLFDGLIEDNSDNAVIMAVHYSGNLMNATSTAMSDNFGTIGQPTFYLGNEDQNANGNSSAKREQIRNAVDAIAAQSPVANTGLTASLNGNELVVNTKTRFFQTTSGEYYMVLYIIEDGVIASQTGQGANASHKNLLRGAMTTDAFGTLLKNGDISMGEEFTETVTFQLDPSWNTEQMQIAAVIWKKENNTFNFVNTNSTVDLNTANVNELSDFNNQIKTLPTVADESLQVQLELISSSEQAHLRLYNLNGQLLHTLYSGRLNQGSQQFELLRSQVGGSGLYVLTLATEQGLVSRKVIFR
ncbi:MAG: Omp28-related outer membrane protein [Bacteroidota bacterium]